MLYTHVAAILLGAAIGGTGAWQIQSWRYSAKIAEIHERHNDELKESLLKAQANFKRVSNASANAQNRSQVIQDNAVAAKSELDRLRNAIPPAVCPASPPPIQTPPSQSYLKSVQLLLKSWREKLTDTQTTLGR